jgi:hypothetical protein
MTRKINSITFIIIIVLTLTVIFSFNKASAHKINGKEHEPITCKLPEDRTFLRNNGVNNKEKCIVYVN